MRLLHSSSKGRLIAYPICLARNRSSLQRNICSYLGNANFDLPTEAGAFEHDTTLMSRSPGAG
jgi:hypothetical protein